MVVAPAVNILARFLEDPARPPDTFRYHEVQGFLFAVATSPDLVYPSEWIPVIFAGGEARYADLAEAKVILPALTVLYNEVNSSVRSARPALPADCRFRRDVLANFADDAPVSLWSRGFIAGYEWLEESWEDCVPDEYDHDFGMLLMTLSFFATERLATVYLKEIRKPGLAAGATLFRRVFPDALAEFAHIARGIQKAVAKER